MHAWKRPETKYRTPAHNSSFSSHKVEPIWLRRPAKDCRLVRMLHGTLQPVRAQNDYSVTQFPQTSSHRDHSAHRHHVFPVGDIPDGISEHDPKFRTAVESSRRNHQHAAGTKGFRRH